MKLIDLSTLNLSQNASSVIAKYIPLLNKPCRFAQLPNNFPNFGCMSDNADGYLIGIRTNAPKPDLESTICHELLHAYQFSIGFPTVIGTANDTNTYCERLRSNVLDLYVNDIIKANGMTYNHIIQVRYSQLKKLCSTSFQEINDKFKMDLLTIDLILDLNDLHSIQKSKILDNVQRNIPAVFHKYNEYHNIIFEKFGYDTKEGCFSIFGYIFSDIGLWDACSIFYGEREIKTVHRFNRISASNGGGLN